MINKNRFKFRYLDNATKFMYNVMMFDIEDNYAQVNYFHDKEAPIEEVKLSDGVLMQCTGLKDKNNQIIYENDIIEIRLKGQLHNFIIRYQQNNGSFALVATNLKNVDMPNKAFCMSLRLATSGIVIGNVYQNQELLNH